MEDERRLLLKELIREKAADSNKGTNRLLSVIAGSTRYRGAAYLAVAAAARCGVGIVRLISVEPVIAACAAKLAECIYLPVAETAEGAISPDGFAAALPLLRSSGAVLIGCGMSDCAETAEILSGVIGEAECPLVIDADGLNVLRDKPSALLKAAQTPIITPHVGEMARLTGLPIRRIKEDRLRTAAEFAARCRCVTVLKDSVTTVCDPEGRTFVCDRPNAGLAKGGSGDLLAGMIASFAAQGYPPFEAAACGVALHSLAASLAAEELTAYAMLPSDILRYIPQVFAGIRPR